MQKLSFLWKIQFQGQLQHILVKSNIQQYKEQIIQKVVWYSSHKLRKHSQYETIFIASCLLFFEIEEKRRVAVLLNVTWP